MKLYNKRGGQWVATSNQTVFEKINELYTGLLEHDGYGELRVEVKILKKGQKEVILHCGKQYRYVIDWENKNNPRLVI